MRGLDVKRDCIQDYITYILRDYKLISSFAKVNIDIFAGWLQPPLGKDKVGVMFTIYNSELSELDEKERGKYLDSYQRIIKEKAGFQFHLHERNSGLFPCPNKKYDYKMTLYYILTREEYESYVGYARIQFGNKDIDMIPVDIKYV